MNNRYSVCVQCRRLTRGPLGGEDPCALCGQPTVTMSPRWRAPKKTDDAAWEKIERGHWLWELSEKEDPWPGHVKAVNQNPKFGQSELFESEEHRDRYKRWFWTSRTRR